MYVRKDISVDLENCFSVSNENVEIMYLNLKKGLEKKINVIGVYRPPSGNLLTGLDLIDAKLNEIKESCKGEVVVLGDFNVDFSKDNDRSASKMQDMFDIHGLCQLIKVTTRRTVSQESLIDLIFTNVRFVMESGVLEMSLSDHFPIYLIKKKARNGKDSN